MVISCCWKPPLQWNTLLLWLGPSLLLVLAITSFGAYLLRGRQRMNDTQDALFPLSGDENERLDALLSEGSSS